jgi:hypothetical protein
MYPIASTSKSEHNDTILALCRADTPLCCWLHQGDCCVLLVLETACLLRPYIDAWVLCGQSCVMGVGSCGAKILGNQCLHAHIYALKLHGASQKVNCFILDGYFIFACISVFTHPI